MCKRKIAFATLVIAACVVNNSMLYSQVTPQAAYATGTPVNYVRTFDVRVPEATVAGVLTRGVGEVNQTTTYVDGLGRPIETVAKKASPLQKDMVTAQRYDEYGRERYQYLPFTSTGNDGSFKSDPFQQQISFYNSYLNGQTGETNIGSGNLNWAYAQTVFEASPLNRVEKTYAPGVSWGGGNISVNMGYELNAASEVRLWTISGTGLQLPTSTGYYAANELYRNVITDENGKRVVEYKDKEGKVVLKKVEIKHNGAATISSHTDWLCTYYVYDDLGQLRFVMQPKAVEQLELASWTFGTTVFTSSVIAKELCFYYEYDERGRMIQKKVPGAGEVYMVYDNRDRLIMTQDANMRNANKWMVTKYDDLNRPVETGLWINTTAVATHRSNAAAYPSGSTNYPVTSSNYEMLTQTHYDDYNSLPAGLSSSLNTSFITSTNFITSYNTSPLYAQQITKSTAVKGMATWNSTKVLGSSNTFISTVIIYDDRGRVIQTQTVNATGGVDIATTQYDYSGQVLRSHQRVQKQTGTAHSYELLTTIAYDHGGRILTIKKKLKNNTTDYPEKTIVTNTYDELGKPKTKQLSESSTAVFAGGLLTYDYNIRGWLLGANRSYLGTTGQSGNTRFGFELGYDKTGNSAGKSFTAAQLNGNISGMIWKSDGDDVKRKYDYTYDAANRLLRGDFEQDDAAGSWNHTTMDYSMKMGDGIAPTSAYDANGNIKAMTQYGWKITATANVIDNLAYTYDNSTISNKLLKVVDAVSDPQTKLGDFKDGSNGSGDDYSYDVNGNLTLDNNKSISSITYNHLNLPLVINVTGKGTITYTYDAAGNKLQKEVVEGTSKKVTTYLGGAVYEDTYTSNVLNTPPASSGPLQFIAHEEGRIRVDETNANTPNPFDYFIKDHLGNVRMVLTDEDKTNVYPAATLENSNYHGGTAISIETNFYLIDNAQVVATPSGVSYSNNNGNPPYNTINEFSNTGATSAKMYKLNAATNTVPTKTGLGIVLKVMAGDIISIYGKSYHKRPSGGNYTSGVNTLSVLDILSAFTGSAAVSGKSVTPSQITGQSGFPTTVGALTNGGPSQTTTTLKAGINWILFDEQFHFSEGGYDPVGSDASGAGILKSHNLSTIPAITAKKNGYIYVYCSNESQYDVFFDNLQLVHKPGPITEETHYYPFGLTMAGISSKAVNFGKENKENTFQNQRFDDELGVNYVQFKWRNHDPQIGRFIEIDPLSDKYVYNSTYAFSENKVTSHFELEGLESFSMHFVHDLTSEQSKSINPQTIAQTYNDGVNKGMPVVATAWLTFTGLNAPTLVAPLVASYVFGVPSPTAPTSVTGTVASEATMIREAVANDTKATSTLAQNQAQANAFEKVVVSNLAQEGHTGISQQVTIKANNGVKTKLDVVSNSPSGQTVLTEAKSSATAPLTPNQKLAFPSIAQSGGVVVGQGKPGFPGGTVIPPTQVNIVRPSINDNTYIRPNIPIVPIFRKQE